MDPNIWNN